MKVQVFNRDSEFTQTLQNVINVKSCFDGRVLVTYEEKCKCCKNISRLVYQIPIDYTIQIFLNELDEICIAHLE